MKWHSTVRLYRLGSLAESAKEGMLGISESAVEIRFSTIELYGGREGREDTLNAFTLGRDLGAF